MDVGVTLGAGIIVGLLMSAAALSFQDRGSTTGAPLVRPAGVPGDAAWQEDVFGAPRWIGCAAIDNAISCTAYDRDGSKLVTVPYVATGDAALPPAPFAHIVARQVDRVWVNKVALEPHGAAEFGGGAAPIQYVRGERQTDIP